ncbi:LacI family DNA-binding transcriptional regulator [Vallicoccus soli]|uniref:LacI family transcriptional regulator n=1 Tax=Vallicoccus soli TaxID=2339232 RepID=A0A3A3Z2A0_9ACTN|nr:LacI family DNA-binding transcriptional regulator [Vallicoccus soli]RJK96809.1 LacI family transcriptional regulator [Vallicoccus soli]
MPAAASPPTLESVAARAGVSRATAGRVLSGSPRVSEQAREAVLKAAAELSYVPNHAARSLVTRRAGSVAFVVGEEEERFFADPYFAGVLRGVRSEVRGAGVQLVLVVMTTDEERERFATFARGGHVDGAMFVSVHGADPLPAALRAAGVPVVVSGRPYDVPAGRRGAVPYVASDNRGGGRLAARALLARGCGCVATVTGPQDMSAAQDRLAGFLEGLGERGLRPAPGGTQEGDYSRAGGRAAAERLLERVPDVDGVFAANDLMAAGVLDALVARGRRVPEDVAVVGFDDVPVARETSPLLTTVRQDVHGIGAAMARLLLELAAGGDPDPVVLPTGLVARASA